MSLILIHFPLPKTKLLTQGVRHLEIFLESACQWWLRILYLPRYPVFATMLLGPKSISINPAIVCDVPKCLAQQVNTTNYKIVRAAVYEVLLQCFCRNQLLQMFYQDVFFFFKDQNRPLINPYGVFVVFRINLLSGPNMTGVLMYYGVKIYRVFFCFYLHVRATAFKNTRYITGCN